MGLDMYLRGRKTLYGSNRKEDGFEIHTIEVDLGYWRKHPDLHGFIVNSFADKDENGEPIDNCEEIALSLEDINTIIEAVKAGTLPTTQGFFFGESYKKDNADEATEYQQQVEEDVTLLSHAVAWLAQIDAKEPEQVGQPGVMVWREVFYRASW